MSQVFMASIYRKRYEDAEEAVLKMLQYFQASSASCGCFLQRLADLAHTQLVGQSWMIILPEKRMAGHWSASPRKGVGRRVWRLHSGGARCCLGGEALVIPHFLDS